MNVKRWCIGGSPKPSACDWIELFDEIFPGLERVGRDHLSGVEIEYLHRIVDLLHERCCHRRALPDDGSAGISYFDDSHIRG